MSPCVTGHGAQAGLSSLGELHLSKNFKPQEHQPLLGWWGVSLKWLIYSKRERVEQFQTQLIYSRCKFTVLMGSFQIASWGKNVSDLGGVVYQLVNHWESWWCMMVNDTGITVTQQSSTVVIVIEGFTAAAEKQLITSRLTHQRVKDASRELGKWIDQLIITE